MISAAEHEDGVASFLNATQEHVKRLHKMGPVKLTLNNKVYWILDSDWSEAAQIKQTVNKLNK